MSKKQTVGYRYYLGFHMVLCHGPIDKIVQIDVDGKTAWTGNVTGGALQISAEELFGGETKEGGVSGSVDVEMGGPTQGTNAYLVEKLGPDIPAYRGVAAMVLKQCYIGMSPYLKRWAFWGERIHIRQNGLPQWYDAKAAVGNDMNPAHIIRECLTDINWGMGYNESSIDNTNFTAAADQFHSEGMGISLLWDKGMPIQDFIETILKHADASLYVDRVSGLFKLKLARADYDVNTLLVLNEDNVEKITDFKRNTVGELINSVTVIYWDGTTGGKASVTVQDAALASLQQATIGTTKQFPGFTNSTLAMRAASRTLKALSLPLASATIYTNRAASGLNVGDVFKLSWTPYGLTQIVMRVAKIELGSLGNNVVKINCVEDVFGISSAIYAAPPPSEWTPPTSTPAPCLYHSMIEAPYWEVVQLIGEDDAQAKALTSGYAVISGVRPSSDASNAILYSDPTNTLYEEAGTADFCPTAVNTAAVGRTETVITISSTIDIDLVALNSYAVWGAEIVQVTAVSTTQMTVVRGCLDTVPTLHAVSERVFFSDFFYETDGIEYAAGEIARNKLLPSTGLGTLAIGSAPAQTVTMNSRLSRPYPPARLVLNSTYFNPVIQGDVDLVVSWRHRDRLQQTATLIGSAVDSNIGPEAGTTYTIELRTLGGTLISTLTGITGTTHTFTLAQMGTNYGELRVLLWSLRDGLTSFTIHDFQFTRTGYGVGYGNQYGGTA